MADHRYKQKRRKIERRFRKMKPIESSRRIVPSPSGLYEIEICRYTESPASWDYSRGLVRLANGGKLIADIKRNICHFWHTWVLHPNGNEYLLCGEDYQGYQAINLTTRQIHNWFPESGHKGWAFCWTAAYPSPDLTLLAVEGCFWACPYDLVFFDFREPDKLPYPEIARFGELNDCVGWADNESFVFTREIECRKNDGVQYDMLSEEEQARLDSGESLTDYRITRIEVRRDELLRKAQRPTPPNGGLEDPPVHPGAAGEPPPVI